MLSKAFHYFVGTIHRDDEGITAIEYALLAVLLALAIAVGAAALGTNLNAAFDNVGGHVNPGGGN
ncbi:MAG: Flp family type IVb pilin [Myxococcales bacterium]|jgi:pilus assembly protein Flp/PilA